MNKNVSLTDILYETRKYMANVLNIPQNNINSIILEDESTMPFELKLL